ncbi:hypothetical protein RQM59_10800 [Flavobacteriaceae bacterium S356]|uniref:Uncharacterized protein n=1 Tax=Asprobacillus argus TaxID=3076534 RepID=A0ABU3LGM6_9FLAO|nr:hypothetical protein [Flavobacteriaceae bacterium S356]
MSKDYKSSVFKDLLDKLQQESWQLELLISGFAIFGLFSSLGTIQLNLETANYDSRIYEILIWFSIKICCWILIISLLIHVTLRGLWIGALGLRYVSGDIDYDELKYSPKFTNFLSNKIGSFDKYIASLENYCSILFAISFLLIFYFLAVIMFLVTIMVIVFIFLDNDAEGVWETILSITGIVIILFLFLGMFLTFIDFITQGFLKRKKWTSKFYFPLYRVFSIVSLSFLYRPLVYNFLDNKFGRRLSFVLLPVFVAIFIFSSYSYRTSNYLNIDRSSSENYANPNNYEDLLEKNKDFVKIASIPSKVITDPYLKVFVIFNEHVENRLFDYNENLKPLIDIRGLESEISLTGNNWTRAERRKRDSLRLVYYKTFNKVYSVYVDNVKYPSDFIATTNVNKKLGFETYLNIKNLTEGKHLLKIARLRKRKKDTTNFIAVTIPFWHFKNN